MKGEHAAIQQNRYRIGPSRRAMLVITLIAAIMLVIIITIGFHMNSTLAANELRTEMLRQQILAEEQRTEDIKELQEYMQSDEYLEQEAQDKLGFVKDGEIIFKESE